MKKLKELHLKEKRTAFHQWQLQPHQVNPMSEERHVCHTCETEYQGNYCPRCGQSAKIGRYSFKTAFLSFLDVWGLGNRGMFRTIRDLLLRPGYMIRDYIKGMQMAYFPPFKMFFLLATLSLLVTNGLNIKGQRSADKAETEVAVSENARENTENQDSGQGIWEDETVTIIEKVISAVERFSSWSPALYALSWLILLSGFLYMFFRYCPDIPDLRYSEFFVAIIYTANMYTILSIVLDFFCLHKLRAIVLIFMLIPLRQLSGYSWKRMLLYAMMAILDVISIFVLAMVAIVLVIGMTHKNYFDNYDFKGVVATFAITLLITLGLYLFTRWITRTNKLRFEINQGSLRNVMKTISGRLPKRKGKVPPSPSEM